MSRNREVRLLRGTIVADTVSVRELRSGRVHCPQCNARGVGYAPSPFGGRDFNRARCRYCWARFSVRNVSDGNETPGQAAVPPR